jgi:hypothetical protein
MLKTDDSIIQVFIMEEIGFGKWDLIPKSG